MNKKVVISSRFNYSDYDMTHSIYYKVTPLDPEWITYRMKIFMTYTRKSFENQLNQDFLAVLSCYEESMPLINELLKQYPPLPPNIIFTANKRDVIASYVKDSDLLYLVRIDSDDMYGNTYIQLMHDHVYDGILSSLVCTAGYIYSTKDNLLAFYTNHSPCFYTQLFTTQEYLKTYQYYPELSHEAAIQFPCKRLSNHYHFIIIVHNKNVWQQFTSRYDKRIIKDPTQLEAIIKEFALPMTL